MDVHIREARTKKVSCNNCRRTMEVPKGENPPYYCYKCDDDEIYIKHHGTR